MPPFVTIVSPSKYKTKQIIPISVTNLSNVNFCLQNSNYVTKPIIIGLCFLFAPSFGNKSKIIVHIPSTATYSLAECSKLSF